MQSRKMLARKSVENRSEDFEGPQQFADESPCTRFPIGNKTHPPFTIEIALKCKY